MCIGRIFSTANSNQRQNYLVPDLKKKIRKLKEPVVLENLNHYRDFISVDDISKIIVTLSNKSFNGVINIASGKKTRLSAIFFFSGEQDWKLSQIEIQTHFSLKIKN